MVGLINLVGVELSGFCIPYVVAYRGAVLYSVHKTVLFNVILHRVLLRGGGEPVGCVMCRVVCM